MLIKRFKIGICIKKLKINNKVTLRMCLTMTNNTINMILMWKMLQDLRCSLSLYVDKMLKNNLLGDTENYSV